jgi:hypothetical protein
VLGLLLSSVAAVAAGFLLVSPAMAERLIVQGGYYHVLALTGLGLLLAARVVAARFRGSPPPAGWVWGLVLAAACGAFAAASDEFRHKILFDEYVIQGTAWQMHAAKEVGVPLRAYEIAGTWTAIDTSLDKRPYLFPFLVSLLHDLTGYRQANAFVLNAVLAGACLALTGWIALAVTRRRAAAALAMVLLATVPLFGQNASGAGIEMINLALIAAVAAAGILCLRTPRDPDRLSLLAVGAVLLAHCRYESILFAGPVAAIILTAWWRAGRLLLPWPVIVTPLLLVPFAWHSRVVGAKPKLWELREGEQSRFAWDNVAGNLEGAWEFLRSVSPQQPGSLALVLLGAAGAAAAVAAILRGRRIAASPGATAVAWIGLGVAGHFVLLLFYYWARFDEPVSARFALPSLMLLAWAAAAGVRLLGERGWPAARAAWVLWALWLAAVAGPAYANRLYTVRNLVSQEVEWEIGQVRARTGPVLVITSKSTLPHLLGRTPAIELAVARRRGPEIAWHLARGTFREVVVSQVVRPTSAEGEMAIDPEDILPAGFRLEELERKRFGTRWLRLSRLVAVETAPAEPRPAD